MARFYANENFPQPVVESLRGLGHDVLTTHDTGVSGRAVRDEEIMAFPTEEKRAVLTFNRKHFIHLHRRSADHAGVIACTFDPDFDALARRVDSAVQNKGDIAGQLIRVNRPQR